MSATDPSRGACGGAAASYALGALEPVEAVEFLHHLNDCIVCRDELASFQSVVDVLPLSAPPHKPPRELRRRVMAEVRGAAQPATARRWTRALRPARPARRGHLGWGPINLPGPALAYGAAAVIAVAGVAGIELRPGAQAPSVSAPARTVAAQVVGSGAADVRLSGGNGQLVVHGLPQPKPGNIYQVWLKPAGTTKPTPTTALFSVTSEGNGDVDVPGNLSRGTQVLVTQEPAGGSPAPTTSPIITASL